MTNQEIEAAALRLDPRSRARLAGKLIESLDTLSPAENDEIWLEEARRRDLELDSDAGAGLDASDVYRKAKARLG